LSCHGSSGASAGVVLETYQDVKSYLSQIERTVLIEHTMPKNGSLPNSEMQQLAEWIKSGAPEYVPNLEPEAAPFSEPAGDVPIEATQLSFAFVKEKIFDAQCNACHLREGRGPPLAAYKDVKEVLAKVVVSTLVEKRMPPNKPLDRESRSLLKAWVKAGAPEGAMASEPIVPTFSSLKKNVFDPQCLTCHQGATAKGDVLFDSLKALKRSPRTPLVMEDEGDPNSSGLILVLTHSNESKRMPPPDSGPRLSEPVIEVIRQWIKNGVPE